MKKYLPKTKDISRILYNNFQDNLKINFWNVLTLDISLYLKNIFDNFRIPW